MQDIERKTLFKNNEFNIYPDACSSKIQYTDTLKKLKYITTIQRLISYEKWLAVHLFSDFARIIFYQRFQGFLIIISRLLKMWTKATIALEKK